MRNPPKELILSLLRYDPESGDFYWIKNPSPARAYAGMKAGGKRTDGRTRIGIRGYGQVFSYRLAWICEKGPIPDGMEVDHIDGDPTNNRLENLRLATSSQQKMNRGVQVNNRSGLKGAYFHACHKGKKWRSQIKVGKKLVFLGYFHTAMEAHLAHKDASIKHFGEFHPTVSRQKIKRTEAA